MERENINDHYNAKHGRLSATTIRRSQRSKINAGERVFIHCGAGIGRTGMFGVAVLMKMGYSYDKALACGSTHPGEKRGMTQSTIPLNRFGDEQMPLKMSIRSILSLHPIGESKRRGLSRDRIAKAIAICWSTTTRSSRSRGCPPQTVNWRYSFVKRWSYTNESICVS
jgi:hypothetical protein